MKNIYLFTALLFVFFACGSKNEMELSLAEKKALLAEKKSMLSDIEKEINSLEAEIEKIEPKKKKKRLVEVKSLKKQDFDRFITIQGTIMPDEMAIVTPELPGRITKRTVKEGQFVKAGQLIATIDIEQVDKQIAEIETQLTFAKDVYNRQKRLWDQKIGSEIQYLQAKNNVESLEKTLSTIGVQKEKSNVYAPISGTVYQVNQQVGELASPGIPIVQIMNTRSVKLAAEIPDKYIGSVKKGDQLMVKFPALDKEQKARVSLLGTMINPNNRTFKAELRLNNAKGNLKPNLSAEVLISDYSIEDVIVLTLDMVQQEVGGKEYVMVAGVNDKNEKIARKKYIKTGESYDGKIVIMEGLTETDQLITQGARSLTDNEWITF